MVDIEKQINNILNGTANIPRFNQQEHAGLCTAGPYLIGALLVCDLTRASLSASANADGSQTAPANVFIDKSTGKPTCIDCIVKFKR